MSQPKRYLGMVRVHPPKDGEYRVEHIESEHGSWVSYDDYAPLAAENERLRKASEWKPIETAPKDGTDIQIRVIMRWDKDALSWGYFQNPATNAEWMPLTNAAKEGGRK